MAKLFLHKGYVHTSKADAAVGLQEQKLLSKVALTSFRKLPKRGRAATAAAAARHPISRQCAVGLLSLSYDYGLSLFKIDFKLVED